jgi:methionyl-tRNA synthetase
LAKADLERLGQVLYNLAEVIRIVAQAIMPVMPDTARLMADALGVKLGANGDWTRMTGWGVLTPGLQVTATPRALFPKIL